MGRRLLHQRGDREPDERAEGDDRRIASIVSDRCFCGPIEDADKFRHISGASAANGACHTVYLVPAGPALIIQSISFFLSKSTLRLLTSMRKYSKGRAARTFLR